MCWDMQAILRHVSWIRRRLRQLRSASRGYVERSASFAPQSVAKSTGRLRFTAASVAVIQHPASSSPYQPPGTPTDSYNPEADFPVCKLSSWVVIAFPPKDSTGQILLNAEG